MKHALVRHNPGDKKMYWFYIHEDIEDEVYEGSEVLCTTKLGLSYGKVEYTTDKSNVNLKSLKPIVAIKKTIAIPDIIVPYSFRKSRPGTYKIERRISEFYDTGSFKTNIIVNSVGILKDGYTAYLVAKMFGLETLDCYVMGE